MAADAVDGLLKLLEKADREESADDRQQGTLSEDRFVQILTDILRMESAELREYISLSQACPDGRVRYTEFLRFWVDSTADDNDTPGENNGLREALQTALEFYGGKQALNRCVSNEDVEAYMSESMRFSTSPNVTICPSAFGTGKAREILHAKHGTPQNQLLVQQSRKLFMMKVFRISMPAARLDQQLGENGLHLRQRFLMHAVAVETSTPSGPTFDFEMSPQTCVTAGQFLWFGFEGTFGFDRDSTAAVISQQCLEKIVDFIGAEIHRDEDVFEYGHLPVFEADIPDHLDGKQLKSAKIRRTSGARVLALGDARSTVTCFPPPEIVLDRTAKMYVTFNIKSLVDRLSATSGQRGV